MHASATPESLPLTAIRIGFIGAGRLATALAWALSRRGLAVTSVASRSAAGAQRLAAGLPDCRIHEDAQTVAEQADLVFVTVPDDAIAGVVSAVRWRPGMAVVHCCAASGLDVLAEAALQGACTGGFHPLQTFADPEAAAASLPGCSVTIEAGEPLRALLESLAQRLDCPSIQLPEGSRALYHAGAHYAAGFVFVLIQESVDLWRSFGVEPDATVQALIPLLKGTVAAMEKSGVVEGMPGIFSRGDHGTLANHLHALSALGEDHRAFYLEFARRSVRLMEARGVVDPDRVSKMRALLDPGPKSAPASDSP